MVETIIIILIVAVAAGYAGRGLWRSMAGLLGFGSKTGRRGQAACACSSSGAGCSGCPMAAPGGAPAPLPPVKLHRSRHG